MPPPHLPGLNLPVRRSRRGQRGFTLLELMAALLVASILAAAAVPTMSGRMKDRGAQEVAQRMALFYREARTRAIGRGTAHLIRFDATTDTRGIIRLYEAVQPVGKAANLGACVNYPRIGVDGCLSTNWTNTNEMREVGGFAQNALESGFSDIYARFMLNGIAQTDVGMCFSPGGRVYSRIGTGTFTTFTGVNSIQIARPSPPPVANGQLYREVFLLPNGSTRVETMVMGGAI